MLSLADLLADRHLDFTNGKPGDEALHAKCFPCHAPAKDRDYVLPATRLRPEGPAGRKEKLLPSPARAGLRVSMLLL
jgi:hypothetical protein